jgi:hypothetical protein
LAAQELLAPFFAKAFRTLIDGIADGVAVVAALPSVIRKSLAFPAANERTSFGAAMFLVLNRRFQNKK